jgi:membrane protease YdiL (CAAX protease family)
LKGIGPIDKKWLAVIILTVPALTACSMLIDIASGGSGGDLEQGFLDSASAPLALIGFLVFIMLFGPLPEELGWRGYGVWKTQLVHDPAITGLIIGVVWVLWHLPLFFIDGTYQEGLVLGSIRSIDYLAVIFFQALIMVWIYNNTSGSIPAAILFHFMVNLVGEIISLTDVADIALATLWGVFAIAVLFRYRLGTVSTGSGPPWSNRS